MKKEWSGVLDSVEDFINIALDRSVHMIRSQNSPSLTLLNIGAGNKYIKDADNSLCLENGWNAEIDKIPYNDYSVDIIHCYHFLEHIDNIYFVLKEFQRVLKVGGLLNIGVPYFKSQLAFQSLDHKRFFSENTWRQLFTTEYYGVDKTKDYIVDKKEWCLEVRFNMIAGLIEKDLMLLTQLVKTK